MCSGSTCTIAVDYFDTCIGCRSQAKMDCTHNAKIRQWTKQASTSNNVQIFYPCCAEINWGNIIYIFSFPKISYRWNDILPRRRQEHRKETMPWLVMTWRRAEPGYQSPWYWLISPWIFQTQNDGIFLMVYSGVDKCAHASRSSARNQQCESSAILFKLNNELRNELTGRWN